MPEGPIECSPQNHLMTSDEIEELARFFVDLGVRKIRLTGGEPMVRKDFSDVVKRLSRLPVELTMTTNGIFLDKYFQLLKDSGMRSVNISLDSLDPQTFFRITKRDQFQKVWDNIELSLQGGIRTKINVVAMAEMIENELAEFIEITRDKDLHVRFIEFMPFSGNRWTSNRVIPAGQMLKLVESEYDVVKLWDEPHATAKKYKVVGYEGTFAFITTMSDHFCSSCNRMRLTADGKLKNCLFGKKEVDLLAALRSEKPLLPLVAESIQAKHQTLGGQLHEDYKQIISTELENRSMINIGG